MNELIQNLLNKMNSHKDAYYDTLVASHGQDWVDDCKKRQVYLATQGKKYIKIIREGSVVAFIDSEMNVYKPATWPAPAKHIRGNLKTENTGFLFDSMGLVFVHYLR